MSNDLVDHNHHLADGWYASLGASLASSTYPISRASPSASSFPRTRVPPSSHCPRIDARVNSYPRCSMNLSCAFASSSAGDLIEEMPWWASILLYEPVFSSADSASHVSGLCRQHLTAELLAPSMNASCLLSRDFSWTRRLKQRISLSASPSSASFLRRSVCSCCTCTSICCSLDAAAAAAVAIASSRFRIAWECCFSAIFPAC
mmetsp:Transcript_14549/g.34647  ORF Transcript_14549/g.34647 Transcript_14549/m.34647 type:complete len:204 (-) Transcript_14549:251-862(-)